MSDNEAAPRRRSRSRSRSPRRTKHKETSSGFRWKKRRREDEGEEGKKLERGYRHDRDGKRPRSREREREREDRDHEERRSRKHRDRDGEKSHKTWREGEAGNSTTPATMPAEGGEEEDDITRKFGASAAASMATSKFASIPSTSTSAAANGSAVRKEKSKSKAPKVPSGPMIVVKVNDRLGTTSKIPCLASDTIGDFKKLVAMQIGRKPHEIMLKRQSERPFKDFLTLADYEVSDGVQLDLEIDTGD